MLPPATFALKRASVVPLCVWAFVALAWGSSWIMNRINMAPGAFSPETAVFLRFFLASGAAWLFCLLTGRVPSKHIFMVNVRAAFPMFIFYAGLYQAERTIPGGLAATIQTLAAVVMILLGGLLKIEKIEWRTIGGSMIAFIGVAIVFGEKLTVSPGQATAIIVMTAATVACGVSNTMLKGRRNEDDPFTSTTVFLTAMTVYLGVYGFWQQGYLFPPTLPTQAVPAWVYQSVVTTLLAFGGYVYLTPRVSLAAMGALLFAEPLVAIVIDRLFEDPSLWVVTYTLWTYVGGAIVLLGIVPIAFRRASA